MVNHNGAKVENFFGSLRSIDLLRKLSIYFQITFVKISSAVVGEKLKMFQPIRVQCGIFVDTW